MRTEPKIVFVCSGCAERVTFVHDVRKICVGRARMSGWTIKDGESVCARCTRASLARVVERVRTVAS